jgi:integrase
MANQWVRINKTTVENAPIPERGQAFLRDTDLKGFGLRITANGTRSYIVEKRIEGRIRRMTLGRHGELTPVQARKLAQMKLGQIAMGIDPVAERRRQVQQGTTLKTCFEDFKKARKHLSDKTLYDYDRVLRVSLKDWRHQPISRITAPMVVTRFQKLSIDRGEAYANLTMRTLRSLLNFALAQYDDGTGTSVLPNNPVAVLTRTRAWHKSSRRQTVIKLHELRSWHAAVESLRDPDDVMSFGDTMADYQLVLLMTGLRRGEAARLRWPDIDLEDRALHLRKTKNGESITLPMSEYVWHLFERRQINVFSNYIFPGRDGRGPLIEPKKQINKVIESSGIHYTLHDLRRTFITIAESLDIPPYAIKRLVNHKMSNDVTAGYIVSDLERLRRPAQKIADFLLRAFDGEARHIIPFPRAVHSGSQSETDVVSTNPA